MKSIYLTALSFTTLLASMCSYSSEQTNYSAAIKDAQEINNQSLWPKPQNPISFGSQSSSALQVVQNFFSAYGSGKLDELSKYVAKDVEWHIPGRHVYSGTKRGSEEFTSFFSKLGEAGFKAEVMILAANETYVIDAHRGFSNVNGENIDINWILLYQIENGKIKRVQNFSGDLYASDAFFNSLFN